MSTKSRSFARSTLAGGAALLATEERPDIVAALMGSKYQRGQLLFLYEGITVPIVYVPAAAPPTP